MAKKRNRRRAAARKSGFVAGAALGAVLAYILLNRNTPAPPTLPPQLPTGPLPNTATPGTALAQLPRGAFRPIGTSLYV